MSIRSSHDYGVHDQPDLPHPGFGSKTMYGLIGKIDVVSGRRDALATILLESVAGIPGCRSYVVANDAEDPDALWVTEVWESAEAHRASIGLPEVQEAMARGRPIIAGFEHRFETKPVAGTFPSSAGGPQDHC